MFKKPLQLSVKPMLLQLLFLVAQDCVRAQESPYEGVGNLKYINPQIGNVGLLLQPTRPHDQLIAGGKLELEIRPLPNNTWGVGKDMELIGK